MLVSVYGDRLEIERREFIGGKSLGDGWTVPLPAAENGPWEYAGRAARRASPQFAEGAVATAECKKDGRNRDIVEISFPAAKTVDRCRVYEYEVTATLVEDGVDLVQAQRRMLAPDFHLPETPEGRSATFSFSLAEFPFKGSYRFSVRPIECFGKKGDAIHTGLVEIGETA